MCAFATIDRPQRVGLRRPGEGRRPAQERTLAYSRQRFYGFMSRTS
jgi:hypothetical protein